jgi:hypothetical protein
MGYVLWGHRGSGDHGCEDWVRGVCAQLPEKPDVYSQNPSEDWRYGVGKLCGIFDSSGTPPQEVCRIETVPSRRREKKGSQRVLWGWIGGKLTREALGCLRRYDSVVVTDQRTRRQLEQAGLGEKVQLRTDPVFLVKWETPCSAIPLPANTVGLCLSDPGGEGLYESYSHLIRWLLKETDWYVALIPYCVQRSRNDLILQTALYRQFRDSGRVFLRPDGSSPVLRGDLAMCRSCVGFAGALAAWGCGVPALCLTGNNRTKGLSQDIWGNSFTGVCPWQNLKDPHQLTQRFSDFLQKEIENKTKLEAYCKEIGGSWGEENKI